jgi:chitinase
MRALAGTLTFAAGETSRRSAWRSGDSAVEASETFALTLSGASGAAIAHGSAVAPSSMTTWRSPSPPPTGGAALDYAVTSNWGSGFNGAMTVTGRRRGLNGWTVGFNTSARLTNIWNARS